MSVVKKYNFPIRITAAQLPAVYASLEQAFSVHDHLYIARYGKDNPELRGCSLLMLGNRVGGERILDQQNVRTGRSCFYRAYAAWQDGQNDEARRWMGEAKALGYPADKLQRFVALMERQNFRILCHWDFHNLRCLTPFRNIPGIEIVATRQFPAPDAHMLSFGQPLGSVIPAGAPLDLILLDDVKMVPVGIGDLGAPVVAVLHDIEWQFELLGYLLPEIDLVSLGSSSEIIEIGRTYNMNTVGHFFPLHMELPEQIDIAARLNDLASRKTDLFYSGSIGHDFYRYKKQTVLPLAQLDDRFNIKIEENFYPMDEFWREMRQARFSMMASRVCNYVSSRAMESMACGTFHLVEEEDAIPYFFSEHYECFPVYRRDHVLEDVRRHLESYDHRLDKFRTQLPRFEEEFKALMSTDHSVRAQRYLRHVLFMTHVEYPERKANRRKSETERTMVYVNEYDRFMAFSAQTAAQCVAQTKPPQWLRRALAQHVYLMLETKDARKSMEGFRDALREGITALPNSLALHFMLGVSQKMLGTREEAESIFQKVISDNLQLLPDDPTPILYGHINSCFWLDDARVREMCPQVAAPLVPMLDVWKSMAWANLAEMSCDRIDFPNAVDRAEKSLQLFPYNDDVQRLYLRAYFGLVSTSKKEWADQFLQAYDIACQNDYSMMHDFAAPAVHLLMEMKKAPQATEIINRVNQYLQRVKLLPDNYVLYPEYVNILRHYCIPHALLTQTN